MGLYRIEFLTQQGWYAARTHSEAPKLELTREMRALANEPGVVKRTWRVVSVPLPKVDRAGIAYFDCEHAAQHAARRAGWPEDRIIPHGLGWAVQRNVSGVYLLRADYLEATRDLRHA